MNKPIKMENWTSGYMTRVDGPANVINAGVDGSATPVQFQFAPGSTEAYILNRLIMSGSGSNKVVDTSYIDIALVGAVGTIIELHNSGGLVSSITGLQTMKSNQEWVELCYDCRQNLFDLNPKSISLRYTFTKDLNGKGILLDGSKGEKLIVTIQDDLQTLVSHHFRIGAEKVLL